MIRPYGAIPGIRPAHPEGTHGPREIARLMRDQGATHRARLTPAITVYLRPAVIHPGRVAWCTVIRGDGGGYTIDGWVVAGDGSTLRGQIAIGRRP